MMGLLFQSLYMDLLFLLSTILFFLYMKLKTQLKYFDERGIPHVKPTLKGLLDGLLLRKSLAESMQELYVAEPKDSPYIGFSNFISPGFLIRDPQLANRILVKDFNHFINHGITTVDPKVNPLDANLFFLTGDKWRAMRHKLTPTFTSGKLRWMYNTMDTCVNHLVEHMGDNTNKNQHEIMVKDLYARLTTDILASCAFGIDADAVSNPDCEFRKMAKKIFLPSKRVLFQNMLRFMWEKPFLLLKVKTQDEDVNNFFISLTKQAFEHRLKTGEKRTDFLQLLLELREKGEVQMDLRDLEEDEMKSLDLEQSKTKYKLELNDELLAAQVFVFFLGGFENSAMTLSFASYWLSKDREFQDQLRLEIKEVTKKHGGMTYAAIKEMKLLDACVNETLRMNPPNEVIFRKCNKTYTLDDGHEIEEGVGLMIPVASIQKDDKYWEEPDKFKPQRFLQGQPAAGSFLPFGEGPRHCIAMRFALLQIKLTLARLLEQYEFDYSTKNKVPFKQLPGFLPSNVDGGIWIKIKKC